MNEQMCCAPEPVAAISATVRVLAIADTDSYLKWSATTLDALPNLWEAKQLLIQNPVMPSEAQIQAASGRPVEFVSHAALKRRIRIERPDVVLLACTRPVVSEVTAHGSSRPKLGPFWSASYLSCGQLNSCLSGPARNLPVEASAPAPSPDDSRRDVATLSPVVRSLVRAARWRCSTRSQSSRTAP